MPPPLEDVERLDRDGGFNLHSFPKHFDQINGDWHANRRKHSEKSAVLPTAANHALAKKMFLNSLFLFWHHFLNKFVELYFVLERFLSAEIKPCACQSLNGRRDQRPCQTKQRRENTATSLCSFLNLRLAHIEVSTPLLAGRFFVNLSAGQKELISTADLLRFDTNCYS